VGRLPPTVVAMAISVVLRVAGSALANGRLAGEAEIVATGERAVVRDAEDLLAFLRRGQIERRTETAFDEHDEQ